MRRRKDARVRSSAGHVGSHGVRKSRLASRNAAHSAQSDICGARITMPLPVIAGIGSDKLTVRKKAMVNEPSEGRQTNNRKSRPLLLSSAARRPTLRGPAGETVRDRSGSFKPGARTERGDGGPPPRNEGTAGSAGALDRHGFNFLNQLVERNWATPIEQLTRELLGARG